MRLKGGELRKPLGGPGTALGWTHFSTSMRWPGLLHHGTVDTLGQVVLVKQTILYVAESLPASLVSPCQQPPCP